MLDSSSALPLGEKPWGHFLHLPVMFPSGSLLTPGSFHDQSAQGLVPAAVPCPHPKICSSPGSNSSPCHHPLSLTLPLYVFFQPLAALTPPPCQFLFLHRAALTRRHLLVSVLAPVLCCSLLGPVMSSSFIHTLPVSRLMFLWSQDS